MYSQNSEEFYIRRYFRHFQGRLLDIGAYDGKTFSNSLALLLLGWEGYMVEPSPEIFDKLKENLRGLNVKAVNCAIGTYDGKGVLHNNMNAVATMVDKDKAKWVDEEFTEIEIEVRLYDTIFKDVNFDFISIDAEGMDWDILQQINIDKVGCRMVCIEWNSDNEMFAKYQQYFKRYRMKLLHRNAENVIYVK